VIQAIFFFILIHHKFWQQEIGGKKTIFITLKLTNLVDWSWFWVMSPMIVLVILAALCFVVMLGVCLGGKLKITKKGVK